MSEGRTRRFILTTRDGSVRVETNLRRLLLSISLPIAGNRLEKIIRQDHYYECYDFSIKQEG